MVIRMKTTLIIDDVLMARVKRAAGEQGKTISAYVETALRTFLRMRHRDGGDLPPLPAFDGGGCVVDVADRDALYGAMERR